MSFEQKKQTNIEIDKYNIKSHLNASFEAEGISVSEALISRTLDKIKLHEEMDVDTTKDNIEHKIPIFMNRNIRTLITVVAAALILVVGLNAIRMFGTINLKGDMEKYDSGKARDDMRTTDMHASEEAPRDSKDFIKMDTSDGLAQDADMAASMDEEGAYNTIEKKQSDDMLMSSREEEKSDAENENGLMAYLKDSFTFEEITLIESTDVVMLTISSMTSNETYTISSSVQIQDFYSLMKKHVFMQGTQDDTDALYVLKISSEDSDVQVVIGYDTIKVDYTNKEISSQSIYTSTDQSTIHNEFEKLLAR